MVQVRAYTFIGRHGTTDIKYRRVFSRSSTSQLIKLLRRMPTVCVALGCSNQRDESRGIALHIIPFFDNERAEAKRRRKKWVGFVKQKRAKWEPSKCLVICSVRFKPKDFERRFVLAEPESKPMIRWLRKDEIGCCVYPTIHTVGETVKEKPLSDREKRMVSHHFYGTLLSFHSRKSCLPDSAYLKFVSSSGYSSSNGKLEGC